jgi:phosphatidylinositol alpha-1,6-mannosyltransferase
MTRTLVITNDFPPRRGGIESFVFSLCEEMPPDDLVVYTARMDGSAEVDRTVDYPVVRDRSRVLLPTRRVGSAVQRVARELGCDRVVFGAAAPLGLLSQGLRRSGVATLVGITHGHEVWWAKVPGARQLLRRIGDDTDALTYVSDYCRREITKSLSPEAARRMERLSPRVDSARFHAGLDGGAVRARLGIPPHRPVVLAASRLVRRKGQDMLIRAWPEVLGRHPDALLLIVGDGPSRRRLARMIRTRRLDDSITMLPGVPWEDMPALYAAADVFALPCRTRLWGLEPEAFGIVFLEAAAVGLPVLAGDSGGAHEALTGADGRLVDPRDQRSISEVLVELLDQSLRPHSGRREDRPQERVAAPAGSQRGRRPALLTIGEKQDRAG